MLRGLYDIHTRRRNHEKCHHEKFTTQNIFNLNFFTVTYDMTVRLV